MIHVKGIPEICQDDIVRNLQVNIVENNPVKDSISIEQSKVKEIIKIFKKGVCNKEFIFHKKNLDIFYDEISDIGYFGSISLLCGDVYNFIEDKDKNRYIFILQCKIGKQIVNIKVYMSNIDDTRKCKKEYFINQHIIISGMLTWYPNKIFTSTIDSDWHQVSGIQLIHNVQDDCFITLCAKEGTLQKRLNRSHIESLSKQSVIFNPQNRRIALIGYYNSRAIDDFKFIMNKNNAINVKTYYIKNGISNIIDLLKRIENEKFDCVVIVRGRANNKELLAVFDEYTLAQYVSNYSLPIILGIGHARDRLLLEQLVYYSAITPTAAAFYIKKVYRKNEPWYKRLRIAWRIFFNNKE